jgi:hypothetical protein
VRLVLTIARLSQWQFRAEIPQHAFEVLSYAAKHGHAELVNLAAYKATTKPLQAAYQSLTPAIYVAWVRVFTIAYAAG